MKLVFIHGWGLDPHSWEATSNLLPYYEQDKVDLGFFGTVPSTFDSAHNCILIGHSLGFLQGILQKRNWRGWIAINSFPRFIRTDAKTGCVPAAALRDIRVRLLRDPVKTLNGFHDFINAKTPGGMPDTQRLCTALDLLHDGDAAETLAALDVPGLVLASRNDPLVPKETSLALGKNKDIAWHESGGHILPQNDPAWCAEQINGFMKKHFN